MGACSLMIAATVVPHEPAPITATDVSEPTVGSIRAPMFPDSSRALACGAVVVSEARPEIGAVFPALPVFSDAGYRRVLALALRHRKLTVGIGAGLFVLSLLSIPLLPTAFLADSDYGFFVATVELPPGTSLAETDRAIRATRATAGCCSASMKKMGPSAGSSSSPRTRK